MTADIKWSKPTKNFVCMDRQPESVPGSGANTNPAVLYNVEAGCNGLPCPPYDPHKELTCVVCSILNNASILILLTYMHVL